MFSVACSKDGVWHHVSCSYGPLNQPKPLRDFTLSPQCSWSRRSCECCVRDVVS